MNKYFRKFFGGPMPITTYYAWLIGGSLMLGQLFRWAFEPLGMPWFALGLPLLYLVIVVYIHYLDVLYVESQDW